MKKNICKLRFALISRLEYNDSGLDQVGHKCEYGVFKKKNNRNGMYLVSKSNLLSVNFHFEINPELHNCVTKSFISSQQTV